MAANALLIGPRYDDLRGVEQDITVMAKALRARGFTLRYCVGGDATRRGILAAYENLIESTAAGDAVVVYYSGHGGFVDNRTSPLDWQFLVPTDYGQSTPDDFRGITSVELSIFQDRLRERTRNITVILDCCHAGFMSRDPQMRIRAVPAVPSEWIQAHLERLVAGGLQVQRWRTEGSPDVVRIVACAPRQKAAEYETDGVWIGLLTESLTMALREAGDQPITWAAIMDRVRQRVIDLSFEQRPTVEGPENRLLFQTVEADLLMSLPVSETGSGQRLRLECAPLLAVQLGDEFVVMPPGATGIDRSTSIGALVVDTIAPFWAEGRLTPAPGRRPGVDAPTGARAFRSKMAAARLPVRVCTDHPHALAVISALRVAPLVRPALPHDDWQVEVRIEPDGGLTICDQLGPLHEPRPADAEGIERVMRDLKILSQAAQLRRLTGSPRWALRAQTRVEWGRVVGGEPQPLDSGHDLHVGDRVYVRVHNDGRHDIYVSIVDIGLSGRINVVTGQVGGWLVRPGGCYTFGQEDLTGRLTGSVVTWPEGLEPAAARPESLQVYVMSGPQDLRALMQPGIAYRGHPEDRDEDAGSPLVALLDQLRTGEDRDVPAEGPTVVRYDVHQFDFGVTVRSS